MNPAEHRSFVERLIEQPHDEATLRLVYDAAGTNPATYADLLVLAAGGTTEHVAASRWLTEAARVKLLSLSDERGSARLLEAALERDPLNLRAAGHLVELLRSTQDDHELTELVRRRARALRDSYMEAHLNETEAALAFEHLSGVYEALGDPEEALSALRTALDFERDDTRHTTPSPPPERPRSSHRLRGAASERMAPPPERPFTITPSSSRRDTIRSPVPGPNTEEASPEDAGEDREPLTSADPARATLSAPGSAPRAPLLSVVEALHALRRIDDVVEGAALVLKSAQEAIPSALGLVHVADVGTRDFVVVAASGTGSANVVGTRATESDPILEKAQREGEAVSVGVENHYLFTGTRFRAMPPLTGVLCAPVEHDGRVLGAVELVDAADGRAFSDADRHALTYLGERFAEFLAERNLAF